MFSGSEEIKRLILHTLDHMLRFTHPTALVESNPITAMLKLKRHTSKIGSVYEAKTKD